MTDEADVMADGDELPLTDGLIDRDMPCIRCTYNLRGLKPEGQCPECGAKIGETVAFIMQRVLCNVCLQPNHPMASLCSQCNTPISAAASTADYYRPRAMTARPLREYPDDEPVEPAAPSVAFVAWCWALGCAGVVMIAFKIAGAWAGDADPLKTPRLLLQEHLVETGFLLVLMVFPLCLFYFPLVRYVHLRGQYRKDHAEFTAKMRAAEMKEDAEGTEPWRISEEGTGE